MKRNLFALFCLIFTSVANATGLSGSASVNVTSDTAVSAKNMAMAEARRQIITDVLNQYSDRGVLAEKLRSATDDVLTTMIATTAIDGEQTSDTTYSANISMSLDLDTVRNWLQENEVHNWLPDVADNSRFAVFVEFKSPLADWAQLNKIAQEEKINMQTKFIQGSNMTVEIPVTQRGDFTIAVRENGWRFSNVDSGLRIWK